MNNYPVLAQWRNGIRMWQIAHLRAAAHYKRLHRLLGVPVVVLAGIVSTTVFTAAAESENKNILLITGVLSGLAAVMAGVQTFLNYAELATQHQAAGNKYGQLRRRFDELLALPIDEGNIAAILAEIRGAWDKIEEESPTAPQRFVDQGMKMVAKSRKEAADKAGGAGAGQIEPPQPDS